MISILDEGQSWVLEKLMYDDVLEIYLKELKLGVSTNLNVGDKLIENVIQLKPAADSMRIRISFGWYLSWQCLNESATTDLKGDIDDGLDFISILSRSTYLDYIIANHGWYADIQENPAVHYRIWSENEVIDVVAFDEPKVENLNA